MSLKQWLRVRKPYALWRRYREHAENRQFAGLVDQWLGGASDDGRATMPATTSRQLAERAGRRRAVSYDARARHTVGFGTEEWEAFGLWQAFRAAGSLTLFDYQDWMRRQAADPLSPDIASRLAEAFLGLVRTLVRDGRHPDVAYFYCAGRYVSDDLLQALHDLGIWTVVMSLDDKHQFLRPVGADGESHQLRVARQADLYWTTWKTGTLIVAAAGGRPWLAPEGADPGFHRPLAVQRDIDVLFIGQAYGARRDTVEFLRARGFRVAAHGGGWPGGFVSFERTIELISRAHVVLGVGGVGHQSDVKHLKGRDFEVPMCGALYLTSYNPELADYFVIGREVLCYGSLEECVDQLHWILRHPEEAEAVRRRALARSRSEHTWQRRVGDCLDLLAASASPGRAVAAPTPPSS